LIAASLVAAAAACGGGGEAAPGAAGGPAGGPAMAMPVGIAELKATPVDDASEFVGVLKSRRSSVIQPQAEGFVTKILVKSGDRVSTGTQLFEIDDTPQRAAVSALESTRAAREADVAFARAQLDRAKKLLDVGASSQQEFDQATNASRTAEAQLKALDDQIRQQQAELSYYQVRAPIAGVIGDIPVRVGDRVSKATELTNIDDNSGLEIYLNVPVAQASKLRTGLTVNIVDQAGQTLATERLNFVSASVDEQTQTVLAKAPLTSPGFRDDQFVRARIVWSTQPALVIPLTAVLRVSGQYFIYVAEQGQGGLVARQRAVTVGQVVGQNYVVQGGAKEGERIVVSGIQKIGDGMPIQAAPAGPPAAGDGRGAATPNGGGR
jgi:RND family efflux transporter MFP subunit